jgi:hypothetical protein
LAVFWNLKSSVDFLAGPVLSFVDGNPVACEQHVASIRTFIRPQDGYFDDAATQVMGEAFDAARKQIEGAGEIVYEAIAARIIAAAQMGERDPTRLYKTAVAGLGYEKPPQLRPAFGLVT